MNRKTTLLRSAALAALASVAFVIIAVPASAQIVNGNAGAATQSTGNAMTSSGAIGAVHNSANVGTQAAGSVDTETDSALTTNNTTANTAAGANVDTDANVQAKTGVKTDANADADADVSAGADAQDPQAGAQTTSATIAGDALTKATVKGNALNDAAVTNASGVALGSVSSVKADAAGQPTQVGVLLKGDSKSDVAWVDASKFHYVKANNSLTTSLTASQIRAEGKGGMAAQP